METQLDLRKNIVLDLKKRLGIKHLTATVVLVLDRSGSMSHLYDNGTCQTTVERILPVGLGFDDNGEIDFYLFHQHFRKLVNVTSKNVTGYVNSHVRESYGSTNYAPVINEIVKEFGNKTTTSGGGIFSFGKTTTKVSGPIDNPVYVVFITDGNCDDRADAREAILKASQHGIFFQFIGIGSATFAFLQELDTMPGRLIDNANFIHIRDLEHITDEELYSQLMTEFPGWVPQAKTHNLIK